MAKSTLKSEIAPKGLNFKVNQFNIGDKFATIYTVLEYPSIIGPGYLSNISSIPGAKVVVKHIPIELAIMQKAINKEVAELKEEYQKENDLTFKERIRNDYESLDNFVSMLASSQSKVFDFQLHIMVVADSQEELDNRKVQIRNFLLSLQMRAIPMMFEQEKILKSMIPVFPKQDIEERVGVPIPSPTMAAMYPYVFDSIKDTGKGTLLGMDSSGGVVLFNQFLYQTKKEPNRNNANIIILGTSGSGKSTTAKLLLRGHIRNNYQIICIDPEGELESMAKQFGGSFVDLGKGGSWGMINPLEIVADTEEGDMNSKSGTSILTSALQSVRAFMKYYIPDIEDDVLQMFSEVLQETYKRFGIDYETDFSKVKTENFPTFDDLYTTVKGKLISMPEATRERDVMERLELRVRPFINEARYYFNGHTTIASDSKFIVFSIKNLMNGDANTRNALFFNILKYAWSLSLDKSVNSIMYVDEAHVLLSSNNELGAEYLAQMQRRARKYNTGTIIITQQPTDFASPQVITQGKAIFDNASYYLVMGLKKQAVEDLAKLIDLNDAEKESIKTYPQGRGLFVCGSRRMIIDVVLTQDELDSFGGGGGL
ncbi:MAG: ATP-binding protein [Bacilli bacterium]|nr:ATP-binding protein [Bacilli bacterium]